MAGATKADRDSNLALGIEFIADAAPARKGPPSTGLEALASKGLVTDQPSRLGRALRAQSQTACAPMAAPSGRAPARAARRKGRARAVVGGRRAKPPATLPLPTGLEIVVGQSNFLPYCFLEQGVVRGRAVCKVKAKGTNFKGQQGEWSGTGFLVADSILLTNHHVLNSIDVARESRCIFNFQEDADGNVLQTTAFSVNPERLFVTSPVAGGLDYTFVWVDGEPGKTFGSVPLDRSAFKIVDKEFVNIIQHPSGDPKSVVLQENEVSGQDVTVVHYVTDTEPGSSGSPVFNNEWRPIALHHASAPSKNGKGLVNEGIKLSAIATHLEELQDDSTQRAAAESLVRLFKGTDEVLGFFGSLGRADAGPGAGAGGVEAVVDRYQGEASDIDVAFWNIEWFNKHYEEKVEAVGKVIASMSLDIWAFEETSPAATRALVEHLKERYGLSFEWAASEPDAAGGKQTTTVIWNDKTVKGARQKWPAEIDGWFGVHSTRFDDLHLEAVEGKVFDRYPGLFHFEARNRTAGQKPFDFHLVPLHLKAMDEGSKRRRMASRILLAAVERMIAKHGKDADWILGGDFNAELGSEDFDALSRAGMVPISAQDEGEGSFSYVKRPKSLIDHIFLSKNLGSTSGAKDYFIVAADRNIPGYVKNVSDHRPVLVRLSLRDELPSEAKTAPPDLRHQLEALFGGRIAVG